MNLRNRLARLERAIPPPAPSLTNEERLRRFQELLAYQGNDPAMRWRRERARALLAEFRQWQQATEGRVP
jgi:hypothetical protein